MAVTIFSLFAIRPTIKTILTLRQDIAEQESILSQLTEKSLNLEKSRQNYQALDETSKQQLVDLLPTNPEVADLIEELSTLALQNQASISGLQFQPIEIESKEQTAINITLKELTFTFNLHGDYQRLLQIINSLNSTKRLLSIDSIQLTKPQEAPLVMSINGKAYFLK